jgi:hypothetical protein
MLAVQCLRRCCALHDIVTTVKRSCQRRRKVHIPPPPQLTLLSAISAIIPEGKHASIQVNS